MTCRFIDYTYSVPACRSPLITANYNAFVSNHKPDNFPICPFVGKEIIAAKIYCIAYKDD